MAAKFKDKLMEDLTKRVEEMVEGEQWRDFLDTMSRFHRYSFRNIMLIMLSKPDASMVAGYKKWGEMNRRPQKGSAIWILGYRSGEKEEVNEQTGKVEKKRWVSFPPVKVFDISDTYLIDPDGADPAGDASAGLTKKLEGEGDPRAFEAVVSLLEQKGWHVTFGDCGQANGMTILDGSKEVRISEGMSEAQNLKTLIHEAGHVLLHTNETGEMEMQGLSDAYGDRLHGSLREIEAESVAYTVSQALGHDTSQYSVGYIAGWSGGNIELVIQVGTRVADARKKIIEAIDSAV